MTLVHSLRVPALAVLAAATLLLFAADAGAEMVVGESTSVSAQEGTPSPETTLVRSSVSYDSTAGSLSVVIVTSGEPQPELAGKPNEGLLSGQLFRTSAPCTVAGIEAARKGEPGATIFATALVAGEFGKSTAEGLNLTPPGSLPVQKAVSGSTTTFTTQSDGLKNLGFNCAVVGGTDAAQENGTSMVFAIAPLPPPPAPAPVPPALSIAKRKPMTLKIGKWRTVKIKVTNTGGSAEQGSLRIKAPKGVLVKPEKQKLPALAPGASWTISVRLELTKKAKGSSTLTLTASTGGITAKSSLVLKLKRERQ